MNEQDRDDVSAEAITCSCPRIPLCGFVEGEPPNPHTIRGWSADCPEHAEEIPPGRLRLWAQQPIEPCRCGLVDVTP